MRSYLSYDLPQIIRIRDSTLTEQQINQLTRVHSSVGVGVGDDGGQHGHHKNFRHRILTQFRILPVPTPVEVGLDEYRCDYTLH